MSNDLKSQLELSADASGVETGVGRAKRSLADLGATATSAGKQASDGLAQVGAGGKDAAAKVDRATQGIIGSIQRTIATLEAGGRTSSKYYETLGSQRGVNTDALKPYLDQLDAVRAKQEALATSKPPSIAAASTELLGQLKQQEAQFAKTGMSAAQMANNLRMVGPQFTDIVTSLQGGQKPLTVLIQQGGQLKDIFGGIAPAARALGAYVLGLINPFTIAAAAAAALGLALHGGSEEAVAYAKSLILTGNAAGTTIGQLQSLAQALSKVAGTQGNAADTLVQLVSTGQVSGQVLEKAAQAAIAFERATGQAIQATVKDFAELGKAPVDASVKLNESMHYLTLSTYAQIKALQDQGRETDAAAAAQKAYADALTARAAQIEGNLGSIERGWRGIKDAAKSAWDAMLNIGRPNTLQDQLEKVNAEIEKARKPFNASAFGGNAEARMRLQDNIKLAASLKESIQLDGRAAAAQQTLAEQVAARIKFDKDGEQFATNAAKMEREITKARNEGAIAGASQAEIEKRIADIRKKYEDKGAIKTALGIDKADLARDLDAIQKSSDQLVGIIGNQEKVLEAQRSAGTLSDAEYFEKKRGYIIAQSEIQDYLLQQQIKRAEQEKLSGKDAIDNARKVTDLQSKLLRLREDSGSKLQVLSVQENAAAQKLALSFLTARQAAQDYFDTLNRQQQRDIEGQGKGTQARNLAAGLNQIEDRFASQRRDLENQRAQLEAQTDSAGNSLFNATEQKKYDQRLALIKEFQAKSIDSYATYYQDLIKKQSDWLTGANEALQNYLDEAQKAGKRAEELVTSGLSGLSDSITNAIMGDGGKSFKSLGETIARQIINGVVTQNITAPLAAWLKQALNTSSSSTSSDSGGGVLSSIVGAFGSLFGGGLSVDTSGYSATGGLGYSNYAGISGGRALGGPVSANRVYEVNERKRPELASFGGKQLLLTGDQDGMVSQMPQAKASINVSINQSFAPGTDRRTTAQAAVQASQILRRASRDT